LDGYLFLHRKILEWEWYQDINTRILFFHLLLKANWKDGRFQGRDIPRGSFVTSIHKLSLESGLTEKQVRTALSHLVSTNEVGKQTTSKYTVITINNYDMYQQVGKQMTGEGQAKGKQRATIEERNKERRKEYYISSKEDISPTLSQKDVEPIVKAWNSLSDIGVKPVTRLTPGTKRYDCLRARVNQYGVDEVLGAIKRIRGSNFLTGRATDFVISFDWFVKPNNFIKVYEGNYDSREDGGASEAPSWRKEWAKEHDSKRN